MNWDGGEMTNSHQLMPLAVTRTLDMDGPLMALPSWPRACRQASTIGASSRLLRYGLGRGETEMMDAYKTTF